MNADREFIFKTGQCLGCSTPFEYKSYKHHRKGFVTREYCDECRAKNDAASSKLSKAKRRARLGIDGNDERKGRPEGGVVKMTQADIAKKLRISKSVVEETERVVLNKIRNNPELRELWLRVKEEGLPLSAGLFPETDEGQRLLDIQLALVEFWETHDTIMDGGCRSEATQCMKEIEKLQIKIAKALTKLNVTSHDHSQ